MNARLRPDVALLQVPSLARKKGAFVVRFLFLLSSQRKKKAGKWNVRSFPPKSSSENFRNVRKTFNSGCCSAVAVRRIRPISSQQTNDLIGELDWRKLQNRLVQAVVVGKQISAVFAQPGMNTNNRTNLLVKFMSLASFNNFGLSLVLIISKFKML